MTTTATTTTTSSTSSSSSSTRVSSLLGLLLLGHSVVPAHGRGGRSYRAWKALEEQGIDPQTVGMGPNPPPSYQEARQRQGFNTCSIPYQEDDPEDNTGSDSDGTEVLGDLSALSLLTDVEIAIGGAGMSAVSAGRTLTENGQKDFVLLEANQRLGGRMYPSKIQGADGQDYPIQHGAEWCQGGNHEIGTLCRTGLQLSGFADSFDAYVYDSNGDYSADNTDYVLGSEFMDFDNAYNTMFTFADLCVAPTSSDTLTSNRMSFCQRSLGEFGFDGLRDDDDFSLQELLHASGWSIPEESDSVGNALFGGLCGRSENKQTTSQDPALSRLVEVYYIDWDAADSPDKLSGYAYSGEDDYPGTPDYLVSDIRGMASMVSDIAAEYLNSSDVDECGFRTFDDARLINKHKVVQVHWDPEGTEDVELILCKTRKRTTAGQPDEFPCMSGTENFFRVTAKNFISTFSSGVLQKSIELEQTSVSLQDSINVAPRFIPALTTVPSLSTSIQANTIGAYNKLTMQFEHVFWDTDVVWMLSAAIGGEFVGDFTPIWRNLNIAFPGSNLLGAIVVGDRAEKFAMQTDEEIIADVLPVLNQMFGDRIQSLYGKAALEASDVIEVATSKWNFDPLYYGSYSIAAVDYLPEDYAELNQIRGNLAFSGEHTCRRHTGYVHGAFFAGDRTARTLLAERYSDQFPNMETTSICEIPVSQL